MTEAGTVGRVVPLEGIHNLRDLGGLGTGDGRRTRQSVLFRSDSFHDAGPADISYLVDTVGVGTIVDLRSDRELAADGVNPRIPATVSVHHLPLDGGPGGAIEAAPSGERLAARYLEYLDRHAPQIVEAVRVVASGPGVTVIHCRAGKDRTGTVVALVLAAVGVEDDEIAADYGRTTEPMKKIMQRLRESGTYRANVSRLPEEMYSSEPRTMLAFLEQLGTRGGAAAWLLAHGLTPGELHALGDHLLEPAPTDRPTDRSTDAPTDAGSS